MKNLFSSALVAVFLSGLAPASGALVSITANSNLGPAYTTSAGSILALGDVFRVGYFDLSSPAVLATLQTSNDFNAVNALFTPLAEGYTGTVDQFNNTAQNLVINDSFTSGHIFGQIVDINDSYLPQDARLSVWVFNSADTAKATEWGIFSAASGWEFQTGTGASQTLSSYEISNTPSEVIRGFYDTTNNQLQLASIAAVPEPGSLTLILAAGLMLRRRRR